MDSKEISAFWFNQSQKDLKAAQSLLKNEHYAHCLFFLHLAIEKQLKGIVAQKTKSPAPYTHDLVTLARVAGIALSVEQEDYLREVNTFNIRARYDDYKLNFYKRSTASFTRSHFKKSIAFHLWLQSHS